MTSPPRCSYSSVMIETIFDFKFYIDKISEFMLLTFDKEEEQVAQLSKLAYLSQNNPQQMRLLNQIETLQQQVERLTQENQRLKDLQSYAQTKLQTQEVIVNDQKIHEETVSSNNPFANQVGYQSQGNTS